MFDAAPAAGAGDIADRALVLFTKPATPGRVKTRLIGRLRAEQAAALHQAFLDDALERLARGDFACRVAWALEPREALPPAPPGWTSERQVGDGLGARLFAALEAAAVEHRLVAAVGSDHPELDAALVEQAFGHLENGADVAIGPAADGGYYLIALRREAVVRSLFEGIAWSTATVYDATLARAARAQLSVAELPIGHDVDDAAGLDRLVARLRARALAGVPHTRALLADWGLLGGEVAP